MEYLFVCVCVCVTEVLLTNQKTEPFLKADFKNITTAQETPQPRRSKRK